MAFLSPVTGVQHVSGRGCMKTPMAPGIEWLTVKNSSSKQPSWHCFPCAPRRAWVAWGEPMLLELALYEAQGELRAQYGNGTVEVLEQYGSAPV